MRSSHLLQISIFCPSAREYLRQSHSNRLLIVCDEGACFRLRHAFPHARKWKYPIARISTLCNIAHICDQSIGSFDLRCGWSQDKCRNREDRSVVKNSVEQRPIYVATIVIFNKIERAPRHHVVDKANDGDMALPQTVSWSRMMKRKRDDEMGAKRTEKNCDLSYLNRRRSSLYRLLISAYQLQLPGMNHNFFEGIRLVKAPAAGSSYSSPSVIGSRKGSSFVPDRSDRTGIPLIRPW